MAASDAASAADGLPILPLRAQDAEGVWPLSVEAGWNQAAADWRLMLAAGSAFGIKDGAGTWIASALALPLGAQVSWISMVLVTGRERRKGHGTRLLRRCIAAIDATGAVAGLDATEFGRPVYLPLGFRDVYAISRWSVPAAPMSVSTPRLAPPAGVIIRPAGAEDLPGIASCDRSCSGLDRRAVLEHLVARAPQLAHVAERGDGRIVGFSLGRDGHRATHIGPAMAEDCAIGLVLLSRAVAAVRGPAILDVPDQRRDVGQWLQAQGATAPRRFMRMLRGLAPAIEDGSRIMALAGPELA